ncbi:protein CDI-like [Canna indica]|uniref:Protein CDI-like n=1 Tax=Canna indica TaxID=4628 RepID=A0AAQ3QEB7_9LILI|nr:protein CDI-like [Canna indica]
MGSDIGNVGGAAAAEPLRVYIGYDPREDAAYQVCRRSLLHRSSVPIEIHPIRQQDLRDAGLYSRTRGPTESTEFSFTRFLTPYLAGFRGWALFVDCDFLFLADPADLFALCDDRFAVMCVHHEYAPTESTKMDGAIQTVYPRKNWSSLVLYNCGHPKNVAALTPEANLHAVLLQYVSTLCFPAFTLQLL